jgi:hypothetical protein
MVAGQKRQRVAYERFSSSAGIYFVTFCIEWAHNLLAIKVRRFLDGVCLPYFYSTEGKAEIICLLSVTNYAP